MHRRPGGQLTGNEGDLQPVRSIHSAKTELVADCRSRGHDVKKVRRYVGRGAGTFRGRCERCQGIVWMKRIRGRWTRLGLGYPCDWMLMKRAEARKRRSSPC